MKNLWSDQDATTAITQHAAQGIGEDLALRVRQSKLDAKDRSWKK